MKVFPIRCIRVPASRSYDQGTAYHVPFGVGHWGPGSTYIKVQVTKGGITSERRRLASTANEDDFERVCRATAERGGGSDHNRSKSAPARLKQNASEGAAL